MQKLLAPEEIGFSGCLTTLWRQLDHDSSGLLQPIRFWSCKGLPCQVLSFMLLSVKGGKNCSVFTH